MPYWWIVPAAISAVSAIYSSSQASAGSAAQSRMNTFNAHMRHRVESRNIMLNMALGRMNSHMARMVGEAQAQAIEKTSAFNIDIIEEAHDYNDLLLEEEERLLWERTGLDLKLLAQQRRAERGQIVAAQGASGTVIGEGSNAQVVIDQKAQEALDRFIIEHGADIQAAKIQNARAQGEWQAEMQIKKIEWEAEMGATLTRFNANIQSLSTGASSILGAMGDSYSSQMSLRAGLYGADFQASAGSRAATSMLVTGLFSAASQAVSGYYQQSLLAES